ncbi:MAG: hypothetical protein GY913_06230 [Proteobacteria bacterium]|nr:hypothetical protein [Pseudomonadota bacterium]MCP4916504.1 hypothetical protein [Pseudomonadota bacterium]
MLLLVSTALALSPDEVLAEVDAQKEHRSERVAPAPAIPRTAMKTAATGEPVAGVNLPEGYDTAQGWGVCVWDVPIEAVWKAVNNEDEASDYMAPERSGTVDGTAHHSDRASFQYVSAPLVTDRWWVTRWTFNEALYAASSQMIWEVSFVDDLDPTFMAGTTFEPLLEDSMPIAWAKGGWLLIPLSDGSTWVEYFSWANPGGSIPSGLFSKFADKEVLATFEAVEARAKYHEKNGTDGYVKPDGTELD